MPQFKPKEIIFDTLIATFATGGIVASLSAGILASALSAKALIWVGDSLENIESSINKTGAIALLSGAGALGISALSGKAAARIYPNKLARMRARRENHLELSRSEYSQWHDSPCQGCRFYSMNPYLSCALHPTEVPNPCPDREQQT